MLLLVLQVPFWDLSLFPWGLSATAGNAAFHHAYKSPPNKTPISGEMYGFWPGVTLVSGIDIHPSGVFRRNFGYLLSKWSSLFAPNLRPNAHCL